MRDLGFVKTANLAFLSSCASLVFPQRQPAVKRLPAPLIRQFRKNSRAGQLALHTGRAVNFQPPIPPGRIPSGADTWQAWAVSVSGTAQLGRLGIIPSEWCWCRDTPRRPGRIFLQAVPVPMPPMLPAGLAQSAVATVPTVLVNVAGLA
jgi:hypothetical protein